MPRTTTSVKRKALLAIAAMGRAVGVDTLPSVSQIARDGGDPFRILVSTLISLRTKDEVTMPASERLLALAPSPVELAKLPLRVIEKAIYPAGFYKTKARTLRETARSLVDTHGGLVPDTVDELLTFKGVGRKTATLVVSLGYGGHAICVDTHVHRVSNRLGLVATRTPEETEYALMELLPRRHWIGFNALLVSFGQRVCRPVSPLCSGCPLGKTCPKKGVATRR